MLWNTVAKVAERRAKLLEINAPEKVEATVTEISQEDVALAELVREDQGFGCSGRATTQRGNTMSYLLLIALGLLFLAASFLVTHVTGRLVLLALSCVAFLIAAILTIVGTVGVATG